MEERMKERTKDIVKRGRASRGSGEKTKRENYF